MKMAKTPLLSIITVNLNNLEGLKRTVESVLSQTWNDFEFIIIDGGSVDGSKAFIQTLDGKVDYWVSEEDKGVFNAMNKGILKSKGDYILFLNSGDSLHTSNTMKIVVQKMATNSDIYYGDIQRLYENGETNIKKFDSKLDFSFFIKSSLSHQASFIKRNLFYEVFFYNENYQISADWEFFACSICLHNARTQYLDFIITDFDMSGMSNKAEYKTLQIEEREITLSKKFTHFKNDYELLERYKEFLNSKKTKLYLIVESTSIGSKMNYIWLRLLNYLIKLKFLIRNKLLRR